MKIVVIKCGGSVLDELSDDFFESLGELMTNGYLPVFVHGGGPAINTMLEVYKIPASFENGLRVTCSKTMDIVEMVLSGQANRQLCTKLIEHGFNAIGLNGSDGGCLKANYLNQSLLGLVGEVSEVNTGMIMMALENNFIPVITPIALSDDYSKLNVNGDYAAAAIAKALAAERCVFVTDVEGIVINGEVIVEADDRKINQYITDGSIYGGMIPKVNSALTAVASGVEKGMIISGKRPFFKNNCWHGTVIARKVGLVK